MPDHTNLAKVFHLHIHAVIPLPVDNQDEFLVWIPANIFLNFLIKEF